LRLDHPDTPPSEQTDQWAEGKRQADAVKDPADKTHPSLVPYDQLPEAERRKDALLAAVVKALTEKLRRFDASLFGMRKKPWSQRQLREIRTAACGQLLRSRNHSNPNMDVCAH
jgi:hypothetical protein